MRSIDRLVILVASLALFGVAVTLLGIVTWPAFSYEVVGWLSELEGVTRIWVVVFGVADILVALYLIALITSSPRPQRSIVRRTSLGEIRITLAAVESLVRRAARQIRGIREVDTFVNDTEAGLEVTLSVLVLPDINIPSLCDELQGKLERYIRETVGVDVVGVSVGVRNIASEQKARVE